MTYSSFNIESVNICDLRTGEKFIDIDSTDFSQESFSTNEKPKFQLGGSVSFEVNTSYIDKDLMNELFGLNPCSKQKIQYETSICKNRLEPIRRNVLIRNGLRYTDIEM